VRHNGEWLDMPAERLFALARVATVAQLLERDDFARRFAGGTPISVLELLYPLLQGYDSVAVRADVELGGTDQKFNLLLGRDVQRAHGMPEQAVLTLPLLVGTDGTQKMSKSYGNQVGVADAPEEAYGRILSLPDAAMEGWYDLLLGDRPPAALPARDAKHALARALVARFHGEAAAERAARDFERKFVARTVPEDVPEAPLAAGDVVHLPALIAELFGGSRSDARRALAQGGVRLDGEPLPAQAVDVPADDLAGRVLQVGKRQFRRLVRRG
jgi:tyrosyl-tRNA synthetase